MNYNYNYQVLINLKLGLFGYVTFYGNNYWNNDEKKGAGIIIDEEYGNSMWIKIVKIYIIYIHSLFKF